MDSSTRLRLDMSKEFEGVRQRRADDRIMTRTRHSCDHRLESSAIHLHSLFVLDGPIGVQLTEGKVENRRGASGVAKHRACASSLDCKTIADCDWRAIGDAHAPILRRFFVRRRRASVL